MDLDPEDLFGDHSDSDDESYGEREPTKDLVVYLVDSSPKMFAPLIKDEEGKKETHFAIAIECITQSLKTQIIGRSNDEVAICFFNTREKKNLQDSNHVYVFNVADRDDLDRPTARLIKDFSLVKETFASEIGSSFGISSTTRENSLINALWVAQSLLRKGSSKTASKRILLFTNEDDPFGSIPGAIKTDMVKTTVQRARDIQDLGIFMELLPLSWPGDRFDVSAFYADLLGVEGEEEASGLVTYAGERLEDMTNQLRKQMYKKRKIKTLAFVIPGGKTIEVNTYALIRPTSPGSIVWLDSVTNVPLQTERSFICGDTGAIIKDTRKRFYSYNGRDVIFSTEELSAIKNIATSNQLRLLGFKPLSCLKAYHNLKPSTFVFPTDEEIVGSTRVFIALHRSMLHLKKFAVAFLAASANPRLVALVAQDEVISSSNGQMEPPGMHMIYLPYSEDIRLCEEYHANVDASAPCATDDQISKVIPLLNRIDLKDFSVSQFSNPALQSHYLILQALALDEDEMPEIKDETLPDEEGMSRTGIVNALQEFKLAVYGETGDPDDHHLGKDSKSRKRKATAETAIQESSKYDWSNLADTGRLKDLTVMDLKRYLAANSLPLSGNKEALISRILTHLGK